MASGNGELYLKIPVDLAVTSVPQQIAPPGQPISGVIVNAPLPPGLVFKVCRKNAADGIRLNDFDSLGNDFFCPPLDDGLYAFWSPGIPGGIVELVVMGGQSGSVNR